jgi:hypothetical protein
MLARSQRAVEIAFSGKRSMSLAQIASAQGQVFWPSIDWVCMRFNLLDGKNGSTNKYGQKLIYICLLYCKSFASFQYYPQPFKPDAGSCVSALLQNKLHASAFAQLADRSTGVVDGQLH